MAATLSLHARAGLGVVLTVLALAWASTAVAPSSAEEPDEPEEPREVGVLADRADGVDRFVTASGLATGTFDEADTVIVTTGQDFPDALTASYAGGAADAPILLATRGGLVENTVGTIHVLDAERVVMVGGTAALGPEVEQELEAEGLDVERIAGADRYATAIEVTEWGAETGEVGTLDGDRAALLASGQDFPDALSGGPVAAGADLPLFLTTPETTTVTDTVGDAMDDLDIERVVVLGGEAAVGADVAEAMANRGFEVERWAGDGRLETAADVAEQARDRLGFGPDPAVLARGDDFPDALAASVHAGDAAAPILLTAGDRVGEPTSAWLDAHGADIEVVRAIGGPAAVPSVVFNAAAEIVEAHHDDVGVYSEDERRSRGAPAGGRSPLLTDVVTGVGEDHDRLEWRLDGDRTVWEVRWVDEPSDPQTGEPLEMEGEAFLDLNMRGTAHHAPYDGPDRIAVGGGNVAEIMLVQDFEGHMAWVVGLQQRAPFAPQVMDGSQGFALEVAHP